MHLGISTRRRMVFSVVLGKKVGKQPFNTIGTSSRRADALEKREKPGSASMAALAVFQPMFKQPDRRTSLRLGLRVRIPWVSVGATPQVSSLPASFAEWVARSGSRLGRRSCEPFREAQLSPHSRGTFSKNSYRAGALPSFTRRRTAAPPG